MRTLIHNYSSALSTEPMYFTKCLEMCGLQTHLWGSSDVSAFDMFDATQPDVFIGHYTFLTNDIVKYLSQNKKIKTVLNVTGANEQELGSIEQIFLGNKMEIPFVFTNMHESMCKHRTKQIKMVNIFPSVDIFLPPLALPNFEIDLAIIATEMNDMVKNTIASKDTYHLLSLGKDNEQFDLSTNLQLLRGLYEKYKEVTLISDISIVFSQVLFETALNAKKFSIKVDQKQQPTLDKILASLFHDDGSDNIGELIKAQIKRKHTCFNRASHLCRLLKNKEAAQKLIKMGEKLCTQ